MLFHNADEALRAALWRRFAVMTDTGPLLCTTRIDRKIVFESRDTAIGCARELTRLDKVPRGIHLCDDHWHLTTQLREEDPWKIMKWP